MSTKTFTIKNYYTRDIPIDDGIDGEAVAAGETFPARIRRFNVAQLQEFQRGYARVSSPNAARFIYRKPDSDEQALREGGKTYLVDQEEIERRRLSEMSPETRAAYDAASLADDAFMTEFCSRAITDFVSVAPGCTLTVERDAGEPLTVRTGAHLVEAFGGNLSMLVRLTKAIATENTLSPEAKKVLRSLSGSTPSSPTPGAAVAVDGATPAAIAMPVGTADSASSAAAPEAPGLIPSGSDALAPAR